MPVAWSIVAQNLPEHARNPIHTDEGAQAAGFPRALVAGVTTYAYMTHPIVAAWGLEWLQSGGGEFRFRKPVFDKDVVTCEPTGVGRHLLTTLCITKLLVEAGSICAALFDTMPLLAKEQLLN